MIANFYRTYFWNVRGCDLPEWYFVVNISKHIQMCQSLPYVPSIYELPNCERLISFLRDSLECFHRPLDGGFQRIAQTQPSADCHRCCPGTIIWIPILAQLRTRSQICYPPQWAARGVCLLQGSQWLREPPRLLWPCCPCPS